MFSLAQLEFAKGTIQRYNNVAVADGPPPAYVGKKAADHFREREAAIKAWEDERMSEGRRVMAIAARNVGVAFSDVGPQVIMQTMGESMQPVLRRKA